MYNFLVFHCNRRTPMGNYALTSPREEDMGKKLSNIRIKIRESDKKVRGYDKLWFFLENTNSGESNYDLRWVIGHRKTDDWWGVIALFPATHEKAIDRIAYEMALAKIAIKEIKNMW